MIGVLFIPAGFTFLGMTVMGNSALDMVLAGGAPELAEVVNSNVAIALFKFFGILAIFNSLISGRCYVDCDIFCEFIR